MAWQPLGRNGPSLSADGSAVTTDADGLGDKPNLHKRPISDGHLRRLTPDVRFSRPALVGRVLSSLRFHLLGHQAGLGAVESEGLAGVM